jgi:thiamine biosynthesis lipoprotein
MERYAFAAMGTWIECLVDAPFSDALRAEMGRVHGEFHRLELLMSRFRPESELSRLNRERQIEASDDLREVVTLALEGRTATEGRFDPTLHDAITAAGYDRSFDELAADSVERPDPEPRARAGGEVTLRGRTIELAPGASLDLGGIAKGFAADRCAEQLAPFGPALVNAGGDLAVSGPRADGPWPVAVDVPGDQLTLSIAQGGLATSGRDRRRWVRGGDERHHLIDPATLRPAQGGPLSVTVAAASATAAEISAKSIFLAGEAAEVEAERARIPAVIVWDDGSVRLVGGITQ